MDYRVFYRTLVKIFFQFHWIYIYVRGVLFANKLVDYKNIPIVINNRNRLSYLKRLISSLEKRGYNNIYILDNDSTFPPLLEYYDNECNHTIVKLGKNVGHLAIWESGFFEKVKSNFYVYTDSDLEIIDSCPEDFLQEMRSVLIDYPKVQKIGLSLKFDDLPDTYKLKQDVIEWESNFYHQVLPSGYFVAHVDTTFALYRPFASGGSHYYKLALRTPFKFMAHHLPWYVNSAQLSDEELYYIESARKSTFWTVQTEDK